jgi:hypothetical protein
VRITRSESHYIPNVKRAAKALAEQVHASGQEAEQAVVERVGEALEPFIDDYMIEKGMLLKAAKAAMGEARIQPQGDRGFW